VKFKELGKDFLKKRTEGSMPMVPETKRKGPLHFIAGLMWNKKQIFFFFLYSIVFFSL
jgi:hypothetical protein